MHLVLWGKTTFKTKVVKNNQDPPADRSNSLHCCMQCRYLLRFGGFGCKKTWKKPSQKTAAMIKLKDVQSIWSIWCPESRTSWGRLPAAPQSPVWNHMERVTDLHDGRALMERWDDGRWELMIQAFPPFILYKLTINTSQKPWWSWFSHIFPMIFVGCLRFVSHIMVAFHLPSAQVGMLLRRPALLRGLWPWQFGQRRPLGLYFHRSARELSWCNKSIT